MLEIFQYTFMQRAFLAGTILALIAPMIGMFIVVRRFSALADTLAHVSLIGVSVALLTGLNPLWLALVSCLAGGVGIERLRSKYNIYGESVLVLFISGSLALSAIILSLAKGSSASIVSYLFGNINTVTLENIIITSLVGLLVIVCVRVFYSRFFLVSLDEDLAIAKGLKVSSLNLILILLAALLVSVGIQIVGILLIGALMIIPVTTAMQYKLSFRTTMVVANLYSVVSVWLGLYISFYQNIASGGAIVMLNLLFFVISLVFSRF
jgi:zinc transport system permease protein